MFSIKDAVRKLLGELDHQVILGTAYDTAWVARVSNGKKSAPAFPCTLDWLRQNQNPDGSWGGEIEYYHDRVISTVAALVALTEQGDPALDAETIQRGEKYLHQKIRFLHQDPHDTVGFELIFPTLVRKALQLDISLPYPQCATYDHIRQEKLRMIPDQLIYSRQVTSTHSLEFMGGQLDIARIEDLQEANGSFGNSPSATAYFLSECHDNLAARHYLADTVRIGGGVAMPLHPVEIFNKCWVLYNFDLAGLLTELHEEAKPHLDFLYKAWDTQRGLGFSQQYSVPDLDDTAVAFKLLRQRGYDLDPVVFANYEKETHFMCFPYERNPSIGVHIHLLDALRICPDYEHWPRTTLKTLSFCRAQLYSGRWFDKWHASPFYIIAHAVIAAIGHDNGLARDMARCIAASQLRDGAWGYYGPTAEETAYCLQALLLFHRQVEPLDKDAISRGIDYLYQQYPSQSYPALWIDKCLYTPLRIVQSAILSALWMYETL